MGTEAENTADRYEKYKSVKVEPNRNASLRKVARDILVGPTECDMYKNILR